MTLQAVRPHVGVRALEGCAMALGRVVNGLVPARAPARPDDSILCLSDRLRLVRATIRNWPLIAFDRLGPVGALLTYRIASGQRVRCRARSTDLLETVIVSSGYEYPAVALGLDRSGAGDETPVVVDVGAHIGTFVLYVHSLMGNRAYRGVAIEPMGANFTLLRENCRLNGVTSMHLVNAAVARAAGTADLRIDVPPDAAHLDPDPPDRVGEATTERVTTERVTTVELGALCEELGYDSVSLLKVDIEGGEYAMLEASWEFVSHHVETLLLEFHERDGTYNLDWLTRRLSGPFEVTVLHRGPTNGVLVARRTPR
jgi:FkbM family methyltransferase